MSFYLHGTPSISSIEFPRGTPSISSTGTPSIADGSQVIGDPSRSSRGVPSISPLSRGIPSNGTPSRSGDLGQRTGRQMNIAHFTDHIKFIYSFFFYLFATAHLCSVNDFLSRFNKPQEYILQLDQERVWINCPVFPYTKTSHDSLLQIERIERETFRGGVGSKISAGEELKTDDMLEQTVPTLNCSAWSRAWMFRYASLMSSNICGSFVSKLLHSKTKKKTLQSSETTSKFLKFRFYCSSDRSFFCIVAFI